MRKSVSFLYVTLMHSKEDLNCYILGIICSNNSDNLKTKLQLGIIVCKQWHRQKRGGKMLTTAELTERKS